MFRRLFGKGSRGSRDFIAYGVGPTYMSVCTSLRPRDIEDRANAAYPMTYTGAPWRVASDDHFAGGEPMPMKCPDTPGHRHWLLRCDE